MFCTHEAQSAECGYRNTLPDYKCLKLVDVILSNIGIGLCDMDIYSVAL